jgi:hypothetical protein
LGLIEKILGHPRLIPCVAGTGFAFIDPWSDVWACNVRSDLPIGNLAKESWETIIASESAKNSIAKVRACEQNCWMVTTARTAMRSNLIPNAPKAGPLFWVLKNKLKVALGQEIDFDGYIDYANVKPSPQVPRVSYLEHHDKVKLVKGRDTTDKHYPLKVFENT